MTSPSSASEQQLEQEQQWLSGLRQGREEDLERIFNRYYRYLVVTAYQLLHDDDRAQDQVQELFFSLWTKREQLKVEGRLKAYLRKAVVNRCIDEIRREKRRGSASEEALPYQVSSLASADSQIEASELQQHINTAVDALPNRCRAIFALSRFQQLSNKEIAAQLGITVKTVENQMTKALRHLRQALSTHLPEWLIIFLLFKP